MRVAFLLFLFFPLIFSFCPDGSIEFQNLCYFFNSNATQFADAELACSGIKPNGGHLVSIHDGFINALIASESTKLFNGTMITDFWVGLNTLKLSGNWTWTDNSAFEFNQWGPSEPQNISFGCAAMTSLEGYWNSVNCFKPKAYVCQISSNSFETTPSAITVSSTTFTKFSTRTTTATPTTPASSGLCPEGWIYVAQSHTCFGGGALPGYFLSSWKEAEQFCQNISGHLPSFHSYEEFQFISTVVGFGRNDLWTGFFSPDNQSSWQWTDGSNVDYIPPMAADSQNLLLGYCAYLSQNTLTVANCNKTHFVQCQKPASSISPTPFPPLPSVNSSFCKDGWLYFEPTESCYGLDGYDSQEKSQDEGEKYCQSQGGHLISIHSAEEWKFFENIASMPDTGLWTGLYSERNETTWKWYDGTPFDFEITNEIPLSSSQNCFSFINGVARDLCTENYVFCKTPAKKGFLPTPSPSNLNCTKGWKYFEETHSCYGEFGTGNWTDGEEYCQTEGGHLYSFHSFDETRFISMTFTSNVSWTGLHANQNKTALLWTDGSPVDYLPWQSQFPLFPFQYCISLTANTMQDYYFCKNSMLIICKKPASILAI